MTTVNRKILLAAGGIIVLLIIAGLIVSSAIKQKEPELAVAALPDLPEGTIRLRVAHVVNPRFAKLDGGQLRAILNKTSDMVQAHFGLSVAFILEPEPIPIDIFFLYLEDHVREVRTHSIVNLNNIDDDDRSWMHAAQYQNLNRYRDDQQSVIEYARPYLVEPLAHDDFQQLSQALVNTLLDRLRYWQHEIAADGRPVLDGTPYNEWVWWDSIGYGDMPYDVVITNQLVASAEFYDMAVHSSLRGGITAGTTSYSETAKYNAYVYITVYPLINDPDMLIELRDETHYTDEQVSTYAAALLTHELGHLLLHLGHPFGNPKCIMSPTPLLKYRQWYEGLDAAQCRLNSEPAMTPGHAKIEYRADW